MSWWTTTVATALGGLIAAASGWLNGWTQSRRERKTESLSVRRKSYIEFLYQGESLYTSLTEIVKRVSRDHHEPDSAPAISGKKVNELNDRYVEYKKAQAALTLSADRKVIEAADKQAVGLVGLLSLVSDYAQGIYQSSNWQTVLLKFIEASRAASQDHGLMQLMQKDLEV